MEKIKLKLKILSLFVLFLFISAFVMVISPISLIVWFTTDYRMMNYIEKNILWRILDIQEEYTIELNNKI